MPTIARCTRPRGAAALFRAPAALSLAALLMVAACSDKPAARKAKTAAQAPARAPVVKVHCPLAAGPANATSLGGIQLGQPVKPLQEACLAHRIQSGAVYPSLKPAVQALWLVAGRDSVRVLAGPDGRVVEIDGLSPGFVSSDSLRVGSTLGDVLRRRPAARNNGGVQNYQGQLVVADARCGGVMPVLADDQGGAGQIQLTAEEVSRLSSGLRVKRLAVVACR